MNDRKLLEEQYEYMMDLRLLENVTSKDHEIAAKIKELLPSFKAAKESGDNAEYQRISGEITDLIAEMFREDAEEAVRMFEKGGIKTTRGNYGKYGSFLSQFQGLYRVGIVKALRKAGAGQGLDDALRVF